MAQGKRGIKRTPSSTSSTTVITITFLAFCAVGVWMLSGSNTFSPLKLTTITTTADIGEASTGIPSSSEPSETLKTITEKKDHTIVFDDHSGVLSNDAIRTGDVPNNQTQQSGDRSHDVKHGGENASSGDGAGYSKTISNEEKIKEIIENKKKQREGQDGSIDGDGDSDDKTSYEAKVKQIIDEKMEHRDGISADEEKVKKIIEQKKNQGNASGDADDDDDVKEMSDEEKVKKIIEQKKKQKEEGDPPMSGYHGSSNQQQFDNTTSSNDQEIIKHESAVNQTFDENDPNDQNHVSDEDKKKIQNEETPFRSFSDETGPYQQPQPPQQPVKLQLSNLTNQGNQEETDKPENGDNEETEGKRAKEHYPSSNSKWGDTSMSTSPDSGGDNSEIPKESKESEKSWSTQANQSQNEKERRNDESESESSNKDAINGHTWRLCNETTGPDFIPCLDNTKAVQQLRTTAHYEHRERHCPEEGPTCMVPIPQGYKAPIAWPKSRDKIWYRNVPHPSLAQVKGHQNWVKVTGEMLTFPGGGTQFIHGALHYIDFIQQAVPKIAWGNHTRVILDVGCGVASFGGYLFERDVLTMSFAPKDEHEAQVQFALERGIPAISAVMGTQRLPFPSNVFDLVHCARCRVPWHTDGGKLLLELNRVLRPGGHFVWSATPVYQKLEEDVQIWKAMSNLTVSMCWDLVTIKMDKLNSAGFAIYRKPNTNECYEKRNHNNPPICQDDDDPNAAWYVPLQACLQRVPVNKTERGSRWPEPWPRRLQRPPYWLNRSQMGIYGKPAPQDFTTDYKHWKHVVKTSYKRDLGITWSDVRNVIDMRAAYGGFAAALKDLQVWVLNVVTVDSPDTLPIIYERGLFGMYHDWCESFSTYPRSYDLLHADHLFSKLKNRCKLVAVMAEVDRIVRPGGNLIVRDESSAISEVENLLNSLHWEIKFSFSRDQEGLLSAQKGHWRPDTYM